MTPMLMLLENARSARWGPESCALIGQLLQTLLRDGSPRETGRCGRGQLASLACSRAASDLSRPRRVAKH